MESPKRQGLAVLATTGLLLVIWILGAAILAPVQYKALQANRAYTLTFFAAYASGLINGLTSEAEMVASMPGRNGNAPETAERLAGATKRTDAAHHTLNKAWGRFNSAPYGPRLRLDLEDAAAKFDAINRVREVRAIGIQEAARIVRPYAMAIAQFIEAILHVEGLSLSDPKLQRLQADYVRHAALARLFSRELAFGAAYYADAGLSGDLAAQWAGAIARRKALLESISDARQDHPSFEAAATSGDLLYSAATGSNTVPSPDFGAWARGEIQAIESALALVNSSMNELRTRAARIAADADNAFVTVAVVALVMALLVIVSQTRMCAQQKLLALAAFANAALIAWAFTSGSMFFAGESGPLELCQTLALLLAAGFFARDAAMAARPVRAAALIMMCISIMMLFRELDLRVFGLPEEILRLTDFPGRRLLYYIAAAAIGAYAFLNRRHLLSFEPLQVMLKRWPLYAWPVLLLAGELVEYIAHETRKDDLHGYWAAGRFWEELLELNAYVLLAFAAFVFAALLKPNGIKHGT